MMSLKKLHHQIGGIDIYLLDAILKGHYKEDAIILDAGCGTGRNLKWFYNNNYTVFGVDANAKSIAIAKENYPNLTNNLTVQNLDVLSFNDNMFDHIICSAVLHFAQNTQHFLNLFSELVRVLKPNGTLFIRMTNIEGIENNVSLIADGVYRLPDNTNRFLLNHKLLKQVCADFNLQLIAPFKSVNVNNERCMATIMLKKLP